MCIKIICCFALSNSNKQFKTSNKMENQSNQPTTTYQSVIKAIEECNDLRTLKFALLDTLDNMNATNTNELLNDLITCYGLGKLKDIK